MSYAAKAPAAAVVNL